MAWTYTLDPANTPLDAVRYLVGDTETDEQLVQDEEIEYQLSQAGNNVNLAAAEVADALAMRFARYATIRTPDVTVHYGERAQQYAALAMRLRAGATAKSGVRLYAGGISVSAKQSVEADTDRPRPAFTRQTWPEDTSASDAALWGA